MFVELVSALRNTERLYRKWIDLKTLLSGKSVLECTITASKILMDNNEEVLITGNVSKEYMDLYIRIKNEFTELHNKIHQMKDDYQKHPHLTVILTLPIYNSLVKGFHSVIGEIEKYLNVQNFMWV